MTVSLQVACPATDGSTFGLDCCLGTHMQLVGRHMGPHIHGTVVTRGQSGGPDTPPPFHAIATILFADQTAMNAALAAAGPVIADIPNFTDTAPQMPFGEVVG